MISESEKLEVLENEKKNLELEQILSMQRNANKRNHNKNREYLLYGENIVIRDNFVAGRQFNMEE